MMKSLITLTLLFASSAIADEATFQARVMSVQPIYTERYVEAYEPRCYDVQIPVYGTVQGGSTSDVLAGAIIGGALGNQFGNASGKDAMTILGAIIGADSASRSQHQVVTGYRTEKQCENVRVQQRVSEVSKYLVEYEFGGNKYRQETTTLYRVGENVNISVKLR